MKLMIGNLKKGEVKVSVESNDDLWVLNTVIEPGDLVSGRTFRRIKVGSAEKEAIRKPVFISISVEKVEFSESTSALRVLGKIVEAPEDVPKGEHHSFSLEVGSRISIVKQKWLSYQLDRLKESAQASLPRILVCVFDREEAFFALMARSGYKVLSRFKGAVAKKAVDVQPKGSFYDKIIRQLEEYDQRYSLDRIILASPSFWKEELMKVLKNPDLKKKIIQASCSSADESAIVEVLKREETKEALRQERVSREIKLVESLLKEISRDEKAVYGFDQAKNAADIGAVDTLLVSDSLIKQMRIKDSFGLLEKVMESVDNAQGKVVIISSSHQGGKKLDGLGGIGALLRFKIA